MLLNGELVGNDLAQAETQGDLGSAVGSTSVVLLRFSPLAGCLLASPGFGALLKAVVAYKEIGKKGSRVRVPVTAQVSCAAQSTGCNSSKRHLEYCTPQAEAGGWHIQGQPGPLTEGFSRSQSKTKQKGTRPEKTFLGAEAG